LLDRLDEAILSKAFRGELVAQDPMRLDAFIDFLVTGYRGPHTHAVLSDGSARDYARIAGEIEAALGLNLDNVDFRSAGVAMLTTFPTRT
jgi:hypothetical protein